MAKPMCCDAAGLRSIAGYGFIYGKVWDDQGAIHDVNVMPPESERRGYTRLAGFEPHAREWIVYLDGGEVATRKRHPAQARRCCVSREA